jgi:hypothetical protein
MPPKKSGKKTEVVEEKYEIYIQLSSPAEQRDDHKEKPFKETRKHKQGRTHRREDDEEQDRTEY